MTVLVFLVILWGMLQIPAVQNWLADRGSEWLSAFWKIKVEIGKINITFFNKVEIEDFYIEDRRGDTILYADKSRAYFSPITSIFNKELYIYNAELENGTFHYVRHLGEIDFEFMRLIKTLQPKTFKPPAEKMFAFGITNAKATNSHFRFYDAAIGTEVIVDAPFAEVKGNYINLTGKNIDVHEALIRDPRVRIRVNKPDSVMPDSLLALAYPYYPYTHLLPRWNVRATHLNVENLSLHILNNKLGGPDPAKGFDPNDLKIEEAILQVDSFGIQNEVFTGIVRQMKAREQRGFTVKSLKGRASVSPTGVAVRQLELKTANSIIRDSFGFKYNTYRDFFDFVNKVKLQAHLHHSEIQIGDIAQFSPQLMRNPFFERNATRVVRVNGGVDGTINDLKIRNFELGLSENTVVAGNLTMNNITLPDAGLLDLRINRLFSNTQEVSELLPFVKFPAPFMRLGSLQFNGKFVGFIKDFVAQGLVTTGLGTAKADLRMNLRKAIPSYKGDAALIDFDLGTLLQQPKLGRTTTTTSLGFLNEVAATRNAGIEGQGFKLEDLWARMQQGRIVYVDYNNYRYDNILVDGLFEQKKFDGNVVSSDVNFDFYFNGVVDLNNTLPEFDLKGKVKNVDFQRLNFTTDTAMIRVDSVVLDARGNTVDNFNGKFFVKKIIGKKGAGNYKLDSIWVEAFKKKVAEDTFRIIQLRSDLAWANVEGKYDLVSLPKALIAFFKKNHPNVFNSLDRDENLPVFVDSDTVVVERVPDQSVTIDLQLDNSRNFTELLSPALKQIRGVNAEFTFDSKIERVKLIGRVAEVKIGDVSIQQIHIGGGGPGRLFRMENNIKGVYIRDSMLLPTFSLNVKSVGDTLAFYTKLQRIGNVASDVNLHGNLAFGRGLIQISLDTADLSIMGQPWRVVGDNYIRLGDNRLRIHDFKLTNGEQLVELANLGERGVSLCVANFDLGWIYNIKPVPKLDIDGLVSADVRIKDVFKMQHVDTKVYINNLVINKDDWGGVQVHAHWDSIKSPIRIEKVEHHSIWVDSIRAWGEIIPFFAAKTEAEKNKIGLKFAVKDATLRIMEYFLAGQITNTKGNVNLPFGTLSGTFDKLDIGGTATMKDVGMTVEFLQTSYRIPEGKMVLANDGFHFTPNIVFDDFDEYESGGINAYDEQGNLAKIGGGITHNRLKKFGLDMYFYIPSEVPVAGTDKKKPNNFLAMKTDKDDNSTFYGTVYGSGKLNFYGPFEKIKLSITAKTHAGTVLALPLSASQDVEEVKYVNFVNKIEQRQKEKANKDTKTPFTGGLDVELKVEVTPEAEAQLIFDERTGDVISGRGTGDLRLTFNSAGELGMFGTFNIEQGRYLFTYQNLVNKQFEVKKGGTIVWTGSPYEANIDMRGAYIQSASPLNLVMPHNPQEDVLRAAGPPVPVELQMSMQGSLLSPDINFDIQIPDDKVDPRLRSPIGLSLQKIRTDKNELNRQVFALIALQQFLPIESEGGTGQNINLANTAVNTISEMLSQQLSMHINDLLSQVLSEQGIDFEIDLGINMRDQSAWAANNSGATSNAEVRLGFDPTFFGGRLRLHLGGTADLGGTSLGNLSGASSQYIGGDFEIEYLLRQDGSLKLRAYNRTESTILGRNIRSGIGISYRTEFDNFQDLIEAMKKPSKKKKKEVEE